MEGASEGKVGIDLAEAGERRAGGGRRRGRGGRLSGGRRVPGSRRRRRNRVRIRVPSIGVAFASGAAFLAVLHYYAVKEEREERLIEACEHVWDNFLVYLRRDQ